MFNVNVDSKKFRKEARYGKAHQRRGQAENYLEEESPTQKRQIQREAHRSPKGERQMLINEYESRMNRECSLKHKVQSRELQDWR